MADWVYPDSFNTITLVADWTATVSAICCLFLLVSWAALPVDKTNRHYLSVCFTFGVMLMNVSRLQPSRDRPAPLLTCTARLCRPSRRAT